MSARVHDDDERLHEERQTAPKRGTTLRNGGGLRLRERRRGRENCAWERWSGAAQSQFSRLRLHTYKPAPALYTEPFSERRLGGLQQEAGAAEEPSQTGTTLFVTAPAQKNLVELVKYVIMCSRKSWS